MRKLVKISLILISFFLIGYGVLGIQNKVQGDRTKQNVLPHIEQKTNLGTESPSIQAILTIGDVSYKVSLAKGSSVYDLMSAVSSEYPNFQFKGKNFTAGLGFFVNEINGLKENPKEGKYWIYSINNKEAQVGVSNYIIQPNDVISWKYEENTN